MGYPNTLKHLPNYVASSVCIIRFFKTIYLGKVYGVFTMRDLIQILDKFNTVNILKKKNMNTCLQSLTEFFHDGNPPNFSRFDKADK